MARTSTLQAAGNQIAYPRWPHTCIVVADSGTARLLEATRVPSMGSRGTIRLEEVMRMENPSAHLPGRALVTDRTGRVFDSGSRTRQGPRSQARHGAQSDYDPHDVEVERFVRRFTQALDTECTRRGVEEIILIAEPRFLGVLRPQLSAGTRKLVTRELDRDLVHASHPMIRRAAFSTGR